MYNFCILTLPAYIVYDLCAISNTHYHAEGDIWIGIKADYLFNAQNDLTNKAIDSW